MTSLRPIIAFAILLALVTCEVARAQVGGPPSPPPTLWNFLGIPQGIRKLRGATSNRHGNNPQCEPKPPLKAIADPKNLESKDPAIKKAAEVKQAEDLKKQKIKAVKYLAQIGCGCYDIDGGVTAALVVSAGDCTEDVRYETIKAIKDAAEGECCSKCGKVCCCNKEVLTKLAAMAYDRDDSGCYIEPSERVREIAAETLEVCCPNDTLPMIVEEKKEPPAPEPEKSEDEEVEAPEAEADADAEALPDLDLDTDEEALPKGDKVVRLAPLRPLISSPEDEGELHAGVVVHVSNPHQLAHVRFSDANIQPRVGSMMIAYRMDSDEPVVLARLHVVASSAGMANVTASKEAIAQISRGDLIACPIQSYAVEKPRVSAQETVAVLRQPAGLVRAESTQARDAAEGRIYVASTKIRPLASQSSSKGFQDAIVARRNVVGHAQHATLRQPVSILPAVRFRR